MLFNTIKIQGFGSIIKPLKLALDTHGLHLLTGANGAGKTSIFNALSWCLYGVSLKGVSGRLIPTKESLRPVTFSGTLVELTLSLGDTTYTIIRTIDYTRTIRTGIIPNSSLLVYKSVSDKLELVTDPLFKKDQQSFLNRLIGMDYKVFTNSVLFGQRMTRLMSSTGSDMRKLFEVIFNTLWVGEAKDKAKSYENLTRSKLSKTDTDISILESDLKKLSNRLTSIKDTKDSFESDKLKSIEIELDSIQEYETVISNHRETLDTLNIDRNRLLGQQVDLEAQLKALDPIREAALLYDIETTVQSISLVMTEQDSITKGIADCDQQLANLKQEYSCIPRLEMSIAAYKDQIKDLELSLDIDGVCNVCESKIDPSKIVATQHKINLSLERIKLKLDQEITTLTNQRRKYKALTYDVNFKSTALVHTHTRLGQDLTRLSNDLTKLRNTHKQLCKPSKDLEERKYALTLDLQNNANSISNAKNVIALHQDNIFNCNSRIDRIKSTTIDLESPLDIQVLIEDAQSMLKKKNILRDTLQQDLEGYSYWDKVGFGSKGLSNYIFQLSLDKLNEHIHNYGGIVGLNIIMSIDLSKKSKPITTTVTKDNTPYQYKELSGGEQQLVDLCLSLGIHDMVSKKLPILILDEVFENLTKYNIGRVYEFLQVKLTKCPTIFIISPIQSLDYIGLNTLQVCKSNEGTILL